MFKKCAECGKLILTKSNSIQVFCNSCNSIRSDTCDKIFYIIQEKIIDFAKSLGAHLVCYPFELPYALSEIYNSKEFDIAFSDESSPRTTVKEIIVGMNKYIQYRKNMKMSYLHIAEINNEFLNIFNNTKKIIKGEDNASNFLNQGWSRNVIKR